LYNPLNNGYRPTDVLVLTKQCKLEKLMAAEMILFREILLKQGKHKITADSDVNQGLHHQIRVIHCYEPFQG
jgi:hypothetical protein